MERETIASHLQRYIKENGLTQEEFARLISAPLSSVSSWVLGKRTMSKVWQKMLQEKQILPKSEEEKTAFHF
jgi:predicted transcriptional regulator